MPFELTHQQCNLDSFNPRAELHGDETKPAADLKFSANMPSTALAMLHPTLRGMLYWRNEAAGGDLADQAHDAPNLRFPKLGALSWDLELVGCTLTIDHGLGGASDLVIEGCTVNKFKLDPQEGGTCIVSFRVQAHPTERQAGALAYMIGEDCEVTLEPPEEVPLGDAASDKPLNTAGNAESPPAAAGKRKPSKREARKAAEDAFAGAGAE